MKTFYLFLVSILIVSCHEKTFADDMTLVYPKDTKMKIQEFNSDSLDLGSNLLFKGFFKDSINVKYFKEIDWVPAPPPPGKNYEIEKYKIDQHLLPFFYDHPLKVSFSNDVKQTDSLNSKNIEIIVRNNDTIPIYRERKGKIIAFKSYPVFIKNISSKTLKVDVNYLIYFSPFVFNEKKKWQNVKNTNFIVYGCIPPPTPIYIELMPEEMLIMTLPFLEGKQKRKFKVIIDDAVSEIYDSTVNDYILNNQENRFKP